MVSQVLSWLAYSLDAAEGNLGFMVWNTFLAVIPFVLSLWVFRGRGSQTRKLSWWIGSAMCLAFLPNAPYVLTDIIHLIHDIRQGHSVWTITLILVPQYMLFMAIGMEAYVGTLLNFGHYLKKAGRPNWILPSELIIHGLTALGIYLGRFLRFNSWDLVTRPGTVGLSIINQLTDKQPLLVMVITFVVIAVLYWLLKQVTLALVVYWRLRKQLPGLLLTYHDSNP